MSADLTGKAAGLAEARRRFGVVEPGGAGASTSEPTGDDLPDTMPRRATAADGAAEALRRFGPPPGGDAA